MPQTTTATPPPLQRQHFHHLLYASTYSTQRVENNVSARLPNITSPSCDLWPLSSWPPKSTFNAFAPNEDLCQFALKLIHSFSKYSVHKLVTNKQTNVRRDRSRTLCLRPVYTDVRIKMVYAHCRYCIRVFLWCRAPSVHVSKVLLLTTVILDTILFIQSKNK